MSEVTLDIDTVRRLFGSPGPVVVRDKSGKNLGTFVPSETFVREVYEWAKREFAEDDLKRASVPEGGSPLDEVWERIQQRHGAV